MVAATEAMLTVLHPAGGVPSGFMARNACFMPSAAPTTLTSRAGRQVILCFDIDDERSDLDAGIVDENIEAAHLGDGRRNRRLPTRASSVTSRVTKAGLAPPAAIALAVSSTNVSQDVADHHRGARLGQGRHARPEAAALPVTSAFAGQVEFAH